MMMNYECTKKNKGNKAYFWFWVILEAGGFSCFLVLLASDVSVLFLSSALVLSLCPCPGVILETEGTNAIGS